MNVPTYLTSEIPPVVKGPIKFGPAAANVLTPVQHEALVKHLLKLLKRDAKRLEIRRGNMQAIETDLLGIVVPEGTDSERRQKRDEGTAVSVPDAIYPFGWITLQQFTSELSSIVMPVEAPYSVVTQASQQEMADKITRAFRHQGVIFSHRSNVNAAIFDAIALDLGCLFYEWDKLASPTVDRNMLGTVTAMPNETAGLNVRHADPYNISWDPSVQIKDVPRKGEFIAEFAPQTAFSLRRDALAGKCFLDEKTLDELEARACGKATGHWGNSLSILASEPGQSQWRHYTPDIALSRRLAHRMYGSRQAQTDFTGLFTGSAGPEFEDHELQTDLIHVTKMFVRIKPSHWGLASGNLGKAAQANAPYQIWEIRMAGPGIITYAAQVATQVDLFPCALVSMNFNRQFGRSFRFGDHAAQLGLLASTILNMHKRGMRKGLEGGVTLYNPTVVPLERLDDMSGGRVPVNMSRFDDDLRRHIMQLSDVPDVNGSINDAQALANMLNNLFPTNSQPAMAGLDRATTYQAQAVVMTGMRSLLYYATTVDDQLMIPTRFHMQHQNLLNQASLNYIDERSSSLMQVAAEEMQASQFMLVQSQPLIGIDRLRATNSMRDMINVLMQSGGQLSPIAALLFKHHMQLDGQPIDPNEYEEALQAQAQYNAALQGQQPQGAPQGQPPQPPA